MGKNELKELQTCIYEARVIHTRLNKYKTSFSYRIFTFFLDLDEIDYLHENYFFFSRNHWNLFSFYDKDHLQWKAIHIKDSIIQYLKDSGYRDEIEKIYLLTNLRVLGYVFNPVSFYFILGKDSKLYTVVAEVCNTFGEVRPYYFGDPNTTMEEDNPLLFRSSKEFYVSPFINLDSEFVFKVSFPKENLKILVDSYENGKKTLGTAYIGTKKEFSTKNLIYLFIKYPFVTVKIIGAIHYRALVLFLKNLPYLKKADNPEKQKGVKLGEIVYNYSRNQSRSKQGTNL